ncbi:MAG: transporter substrate-binding domain-containing protein [Rhodoglobus sp.]
MTKSAAAVAIVAGALLIGVTGCSATPEQETATQEASSVFSQELHDALPDSIKESNTVSVVGQAQGPWIVVSTDGSMTGFEQDVMDEISEILGIEYTTEIVVGVAATKLGVQSGRNDVVFGPVIASEEAQKDLNFVQYVFGRLGFMYLADSSAPKSMLDLCGSTVAVLDGTPAFDAIIASTNEGCAQEGSPALDILKQPDVASALVAVKSGRADYAATTGSSSAFVESQDPGTFETYIATDTEDAPDPSGMGFAADNPALAEAFFGAWQILFDNGTYAELIEKYNLGQSEVDAPLLLGKELP